MAEQQDLSNLIDEMVSKGIVTLNPKRYFITKGFSHSHYSDDGEPVDDSKPIIEYESDRVNAYLEQCFTDQIESHNLGEMIREFSLKPTSEKALSLKETIFNLYCNYSHLNKQDDRYHFICVKPGKLDYAQKTESLILAYGTMLLDEARKYQNRLLVRAETADLEEKKRIFAEFEGYNELNIIAVTDNEGKLKYPDTMDLILFYTLIESNLTEIDWDKYHALEKEVRDSKQTTNNTPVQESKPKGRRLLDRLLGR